MDETESRIRKEISGLDELMFRNIREGNLRQAFKVARHRFRRIKKIIKNAKSTEKEKGERPVK